MILSILVYILQSYDYILNIIQAQTLFLMVQLIIYILYIGIPEFAMIWFQNLISTHES